MVRRRNMLLQVILMVVTCGFYSIYWFYVTCREMKACASGEEASGAKPALWTVLCFIPFIQFYALYKYSELFQKVSAEHLPKWILFLLWLFFPPAVWFIVQSELNRRAMAQS